MAKVQVTDVVVLDNPASFANPFQFQLTFECIEQLQDDLEWKIIYVGSAESKDHDQVLDSVLVGPISAGKLSFVFQADPPNPELIPQGDILGVTVVLLTCSYRGNEFVRIGYYVNNEYTDPELKENPPATIDITQVHRNILASSPRVTRFRIDWEDGAAVSQLPQTGSGLMMSMDACLSASEGMDTSMTMEETPTSSE